MNGIVGKKIGMTHSFGEEGAAVPVTVLEAEPMTVTTVRTKEKHGYSAVQAGRGDCKLKNLTKPIIGQFKKSGVEPKRHLSEFRISEENAPEVGSTWDLSIFEGTDKVSITGTSKGHGFSGTIKRHGFAMGPKTHGSHNKRAPGSIGACAYPGRVFPGKKLPGQYGNKRHTTKNLKVVKIDLEKNLIFVKGAVPGPINGMVIINKR
jgi:large subunit ribosomal protein L3